MIAFGGKILSLVYIWASLQGGEIAILDLNMSITVSASGGKISNLTVGRSASCGKAFNFI